MIWDVHPGFGSRIRIPDPGVKKATDPGSATLVKKVVYRTTGTVHRSLHHSSKIKKSKKLQKSRNQDFSSFFLLVDGMIRSGGKSGPVQINYGSGSRRPKNIRIRNPANWLIKNLAP
jgi:hypothetical protein